MDPSEMFAKKRKIILKEFTNMQAISRGRGIFKIEKMIS
jgi:hypothetical protein